MAVNLLNGPITCNPLYDLKFSSSNRLRYPIVNSKSLVIYFNSSEKKKRVHSLESHRRAAEKMPAKRELQIMRTIPRLCSCSRLGMARRRIFSVRTLARSITCTCIVHVVLKTTCTIREVYSYNLQSILYIKLCPDRGPDSITLARLPSAFQSSLPTWRMENMMHII